jgi:cytochrome c oxidase subunit 2
VTGYQWKWKYEYLSDKGENVSFFSNLRTPRTEIHNTADKGEYYLLEVDEPLVLPVDTKVRFLVTAMMSSTLGGTHARKEKTRSRLYQRADQSRRRGICRGQCAELCGRTMALCRS